MITSAAVKKILPAIVYVVMISLVTSGLGFLFFSDAPEVLAQPNYAEEDTWITDTGVYDISASVDMVYIAGNFTYVGPYTGHGVPFDLSSGRAVATYPKIRNLALAGTGDVNAAASDGSGGWYVGGFFDKAGEFGRRHLVHVLSDGTVDPSWDPNPNSFVNTILVSGSTVYVGGDFTSIGGAARNRIAALSATTGLATAWNPNSNNQVQALAISGSTIYAGGQFTNIGGAARNRIAAIDTGTGLATAWDPNANSNVYTMMISGSALYVGGDFTNIGGSARNYIAAIDTGTGLATAWNPNADWTVFTIFVDGSTVYAGGTFNTIGGQSRRFIGAVDISTGLATAWDPSPAPIFSGYVRTIVANGSNVYVGGDFDSIGGQTRYRVAALDATTGNATSWNPHATHLTYSVGTLAVGGSSIYIGGSFDSIGGVSRHHLAALSARTGEATPWDPNANGNVYTVEADGSTVYVGGAFTSIGGQTRNRIAALDATTGNATAWDPNSNNDIDQIKIYGSTAYVAGRFTSIGGQTRNYLAALDTGTGNATAWDPNPNGQYMNDIWAGGSVVYVAGNFTSIGGQVRNYLAALDTGTGNATAWNPNPDNYVDSMGVDGSTVYVDGGFTSIGGQVRNYLAALDTGTGNATAWNPNPDSTATGLSIRGSTVYVGGSFTNIGGQARNNLAGIDISTGNATSWNPNPNNYVQTVLATGPKIYIAGGFGKIREEPRVNFAQFGTTPRMKDTLSRLKVSTAANHTIELTLAEGVDWDAGDTLTLTLESDFDLTALSSADPNDYDINTGTEERVVANGGCGKGLDAIQITSIVGQTITFTPCGAYTSPGSNSTITIQIGTNATTGATGNSQIVNPTLIGTYTVSFAGSIGDTGTAAVYIVDDDSVVITANVDPTFTFVISSPTCSLGVLTTSVVSTCNYYLAVGTNASGGAVITIQDVDDGDGTTGLDLGTNPAVALTNVLEDDTVGPAGTEEYGIAVIGGAAWLEQGDFTDDDTPIPTALTVLVNTLSPVADTVANRTTVTHRASISGTSPAGTYSQAVQYIATGTF